MFPMTVSEFVRYIKKKGIKFKAHGSRHDVYINPKTGVCTQVPRHPSKDLKKGIVDKMLKDLGIK